MERLVIGDISATRHRPAGLLRGGAIDGLRRRHFPTPLVRLLMVERSRLPLSTRMAAINWSNRLSELGQKLRTAFEHIKADVPQERLRAFQSTGEYETLKSLVYEEIKVEVYGKAWRAPVLLGGGEPDVEKHIRPALQSLKDGFDKVKPSESAVSTYSEACATVWRPRRVLRDHVRTQ